MIDINSILDGEDAENGERKDRSISERVAIGLAQTHGGNRKIDQAEGLPLETVAKRAAASGANEKTQRKAKSIVDRGAPELIKAVDDKKVTINEARSSRRVESWRRESHRQQGFLCGSAQREVVRFWQNILL